MERLQPKIQQVLDAYWATQPAGSRETADADRLQHDHLEPVPAPATRRGG